MEREKQLLPRNREERRQMERQERRSLKKLQDSRSPFGQLSREKMEKLAELAIQDDGTYLAKIGDDEVEVLADRIGKSDQLRPWASKKELAQILAASYHRLADKARVDGDLASAVMYDKRASHTGGCARSMYFASFVDDNGVKHLTPLGFQLCHDPLCPVCEWRRSVRQTALLTETMNRISLNQNFRLLHLVLTVPNVEPDKLGVAIQAMHDGFAHMRQQSWWERRVLGYYAKTEYTWSDNPEMIRRGTTLHPHMHVLLLVPDNYFDTVPAWVNNLADTFRISGYNPRRSAGRCRDFEAAVSNVHAAIAKKLLADMKEEQADEEQKVMDEAGSIDADEVMAIRARLFSKYRKRFWRMTNHVDEIAAEHRPAEDSDPGVMKESVKNFGDAVAEVADPLYINEPEQHMFLNAWKKVMKDPSITDVQISAVTTKFGQRLNGYSQEAQMDAVKEMTKYVCKSADFLFSNDPDKTDERVRTLLRETKDIRMTSAGGVIAKMLAGVKEDWKISEDDEDDDDDGDDLRPDESAEIVVAVWSQELHAYTVTRYPMTVDALDELEYVKHIKIPRKIRARCRDVRSAAAA